MILGRPTNLWMGFITSAIGLVAIVAVQAGADGAMVATIAGAVTALAGALVVLIANGPASIKVGDSYTVVTPQGAPNVEKIANANPPSVPADK